MSGPLRTDHLPWPISMDNPEYRASLGRYRVKSETFTKHFREVLEVHLDAIPGAWHRDLDDRTGLGRLPRCGWTEDPNGAYWICAGVEHRSDRPGDVGRAFAYLVYNQETPDGDAFARDERPVELWSEGSMPSMQRFWRLRSSPRSSCTG